MTSIISDTRQMEYMVQQDAGLRHLPWQPDSFEDNFLVINLEQLMADPNAAQVIPQLPPQVMYHAIKRHGIENSGLAITYLSTDQFTRMLDYDVWQKDLLVAEKLTTWLLAISKAKDPKTAAYKFRDLEEEYQLAVLQPVIDVYLAEDMDHVPESVKDGYQSLPGGTVYFRVKVAEKWAEQLVQLLEQGLSTQERDIEYLISLFLHAGYMPPNESEALLLQFRNARLEEDGFSTYEDAQKAFFPLNVVDIKQKWSTEHARTHRSPSLMIEQQNLQRAFFEQVIYWAIDRGLWSQEDGIAYQQQLLSLANCLCVASHVDPGDLESLNQVMSQLRAFMSLGLERLSDQDYELALKIIKNEHPQIIFRSGLSLVYDLQKKVIKILEKTCPDLEAHSSLYKNCCLQKWGLVQVQFSRLMHCFDDYYDFLFVKALLNRYPMLMEEGHEELRFVTIDSLTRYQALKSQLAKILKEPL